MENDKNFIELIKTSTETNTLVNTLVISVDKMQTSIEEIKSTNTNQLSKIKDNKYRSENNEKEIFGQGNKDGLIKKVSIIEDKFVKNNDYINEVFGGILENFRKENKKTNERIDGLSTWRKVKKAEFAVVTAIIGILVAAFNTLWRILKY